MTQLRRGGYFIEAPASADVNRVVAGVCLPAPNNGIDIQRVDLHPIATATSALGGNDGATAAEEAVQDDIAACRAVQNRVSHETHGLHGWMKLKQMAFVSCPPEI